MKSHSENRSNNLVVVEVSVVVDKILDLRNTDAVLAAGFELNDAIAPWQEIVNNGGTPSSWNVRNRLESLGIKGLFSKSARTLAFSSFFME